MTSGRRSTTGRGRLLGPSGARATKATVRRCVPFWRRYARGPLRRSRRKNRCARLPSRSLRLAPCARAARFPGRDIEVTAAAALASVLARAEGQAWAGNDPYDGLTTEIGRLVMPLGWLPRFGLSQIVLRFPLARWALRPVRTVNSKALALFLGATVAGRGELGDARARSAALNLVDELARRGTKFDSDSTGWGYPFPWQSRSFWAPANTPNAVVTGTVGWHLLTCWEVMGIDRARSLGLAAAAFLARGLRATEAGRGEALAYTPSDHTRVVNISAIAARLLALSATLQSSEPLRGKAARLVRFVLGVQRPDGSWPYSADPAGGWEDSFHTGYVLEALINVNELGIPVPVEA